MQNSGLKNITIIIGVLVVVGIGFFAFKNTSMQNTSNTATSTLPTPIPGTTADTTTTSTTFTMAEIATHNGRASCYTTIRGSVYDVTSWIDRHPGGPARILSLCGKDGTSAFTGQHDGQPRPEEMLASFKIGTLAQ